MTRPLTWRRVAPAARSRPTSRARSATVIERVLKMRNAPAKRARAAMRAVVAWKSAVEARIPRARSAGPDRTYGSWVRRSWRARATPSAVASGATTTSTRLTTPVPNRVCASPSPRTTVRPSVAAERPVAGEDPHDRLDPGTVAAVEGDRVADRRARLLGESLRDERPRRRRPPPAVRRRRGPDRGPSDRSPGRSPGPSRAPARRRPVGRPGRARDRSVARGPVRRPPRPGSRRSSRAWRPRGPPR